MRRSTTWTFVGAIWGGGIGLVFGALPAGAIVFILLDQLWSGPPEPGMFGAFWGAILVLSILLGASSGYLLGRDRQ